MRAYKSPLRFSLSTCLHLSFSSPCLLFPSEEQVKYGCAGFPVYTISHLHHPHLFFFAFLPCFFGHRELLSDKGYKFNATKLMSHTMKLWERMIKARLRGNQYCRKPVWIQLGHIRHQTDFCTGNTLQE